MIKTILFLFSSDSDMNQRFKLLSHFSLTNKHLYGQTIIQLKHYLYIETFSNGSIFNFYKDI